MEEEGNTIDIHQISIKSWRTRAGQGWHISVIALAFKTLSIRVSKFEDDIYMFPILEQG